MREKLIRHAISESRVRLLVLAFAIASTVLGVNAQSAPETTDVRARLVRARSLAAAHNLAAAANELDSIRKTTSDDSVRDVARLMLMGICLEEGNYMRAQTLLEEIYATRATQKESATEAYFALAGQALNGAREHLERYRAFGISVADKDLPTDALSDLDRLRALLERIADQARQMIAEDEKATAAAALLEDVSSLRGSLARNNQERQQWQREMASARQKLSAEEARMTPISAAVKSQHTTAADPSLNGAGAGSETANASASHTTSSPAPQAANDASERRSAQPTQPAAAAANTGASSNAKSQDGKAISVGSLIEKATQKISPSYPQNAKSARVTGIVTVYVEVDPKGAVSTVQSTSGPMLLRQAAMDAARRWKFRPTLVDGQAVRVVGFINFNFTL
ncbi:MAG TPA: energy transducer TonB [Pyrinomonadaceae bacterium]